MSVYPGLRDMLFKMEPEQAHQATLNLIGLAGKFPPARWMIEILFNQPSAPVELFGLRFKNRVGLAAGYDKDATSLAGLGALGFGHIEVGTITPRPQSGNPKPRVFRLEEDRAIINRMGFPSRGSEFVQNQLAVGKRMTIASVLGLSGSGPIQRKRFPFILGVNIGKNKETPNQEAAFDYLELLQNFAHYADYIVINISSPNTTGLRDLQNKEYLKNLLAELHAQRVLTQKEIQRHLPIMVKIAPDLSTSEMEQVIETVIEQKMDGLITANTTLSREGIHSARKEENGGLSGAPLRILSEKVLEKAVKQVNGRIPIISVGGIMTPEDALRRLDMGASLVQLYTGLIYSGPGLVKSSIQVTGKAEQPKNLV